MIIGWLRSPYYLVLGAWLSVFKLLPALLVFIAMNCFAAPPAAIELQGDRLDIDINSGFHVFSGNVSVIQGDLSIDASQIKVELRNGAIVRLSGEGTPLILKNRSKDFEPMRAQANFIDYETRKWTLVLTGSVTIAKLGWEAHSHSARYDLRRKRIILAGKSNSQVQIVFSAPYIAAKADD